jgi:hypothetical protein
VLARGSRGVPFGRFRLGCLVSGAFVSGAASSAAVFGDPADSPASTTPVSDRFFSTTVSSPLLATTLKLDAVCVAEEARAPRRLSMT